MAVLTYLTRTQTLCSTWLYLTAFGILGHDSYHQHCNSATSQGTGLLDLPLCRLSSLGLILRRLIDWPHRWSSMCSCHYLLLVEITAKGTADAFLRRPASSSSSLLLFQPWKGRGTPHRLSPLIPPSSGLPRWSGGGEPLSVLMPYIIMSRVI